MIALPAKKLMIAKSRIAIVSGETARLKIASREMAQCLRPRLNHWETKHDSENY
jgi:uncharacterized protein YggU (UPF0235/DUF167 family)